MSENYFVQLNSINVNDKTEEKNGLTYLSWAWAWQEFKKICPDATYEVVKNENGQPYFYDPNTGYMCYTKVTAGELTHEMWLPVMDGANMAMKAEPYTYKVKNKNFKYAKFDKATGKYLDRYGEEQPEYHEKTCEAATMFDVNKTIMRCLTKNLAMFGLGLYIYAGEDLPEGETPKEEAAPADMYQPMTYERALELIVDIGKHSGKALKDVYKEDKAHIRELYELGGPDIKQAINIINREIKKKNESKSDSAVQ